MRERERREREREGERERGGGNLKTPIYEGTVLLCSYGEEEVDGSYHEQHH